MCFLACVGKGAMKIYICPHARSQAATRGIALPNVYKTINQIGLAKSAPRGRTLYEVRDEDILRFHLDPVAFHGLRVVTAPQRFA